MRVLVVTWDGGGNYQPFQVLVRALLERGHEVRVLSNETQRALFHPLGAAFVALGVADKQPGARPEPESQLARVYEVFFSPVTAQLVADHLAQWAPDVAVVDVMLFSAQAACERAGCKFVSMHHSLPGAAWGGQRRPIFDSFVDPSNQLREHLGLQPLGAYAEIHAVPAAHIVPTAAALDAPSPWPVDLTYVGPLQPKGTGEVLASLPERFVLVSFSTTWQQQVTVLQRSIDALGALDRPVVVTTGESVDPTELIPSENTTIHAQLPHDLVLGGADAVVTHAGHGTVISALTAGVPLVCVPQGRDQHDVSARVAATNTGVVLSTDEIETRLLDSVRKVIDDPRYRAAAQQMRDAIAAHRGVEQAVEIVERAAGTDTGSRERIGG
jgi:UDP:flavonoid glycosyltransferase YjiC (YdhE family)